MSWIQDNKFIVGLSGATLAGAAALAFVGMQQSSRYTAALEKYQQASSSAESSINLPLYPTIPNREGKALAVAEYRKSVDDLQAAFGKFRPQAVQNIAPQEFTNRLKAANSEVRTAFEAGKTTIPEAFFSGFEGYTDTLARESATGILDYQLGGAKEMLLALAAAKPTALVNLHRPRLSEEDGAVWKPESADVVARPLSFEVTFSGSEKAGRDFISTLAKSDKYYYVIRTIRIANQKKTAPLSSDGKFDPIAPPPTSGADTSGNAGFALPDAPADPAAPATAAPAPAPAPAPAEPVVDSGRVLSQVLGNEDIEVFIRLDVLQFLPVKELPKP